MHRIMPLHISASLPMCYVNSESALSGYFLIYVCVSNEFAYFLASE